MSAPARRSAPEPVVETCAVPACTGAPVRHLSLAEARRGLPDLPEKGRRAPLCRDHYKQWKKATRDSRQLDRLGW